MRCEPDDDAFDNIINRMKVLSTDDECQTESAVDEWPSELGSVGRPGKFVSNRRANANAGHQP